MQVFNRALALETTSRQFLFVPVGVDDGSPSPTAAAAVPETPRVFLKGKATSEAVGEVAIGPLREAEELE